ncbi:MULTISPECIES: hypothetical protein [unclassified Archaeoglobus]|uniref:hypothetical protein n=1 Tax=unclassified Archaeoglobus TaxID=2643606 RepID=UPI0025BC2ABF|nr:MULTISPECIES: hypothetical protein [unclassified Archaeoglobus]
MDEEISLYASRVLDSFEFLKKLLVERGECNENEITIYDDPLKVVVKRDRIDFYIGEVYEGSVGRNFVRLSDEVLEEAKMWLQGLALLKFKRFSVRR